MKLWIDDVREAPGGWAWAKSSAAAIETINAVGLEGISDISFDHDLGGDDTSIRVINVIEQIIHDQGGHVPVMHIHSANPVGRKNLSLAIDRIKRGY